MKTGTLIDNGATPWVYVENINSIISAAVDGNFGSGTATLQWAVDANKGTANTAKDADGDIARTAASIERFEGGGIYLRWSLAGATAPSLNWVIGE